VQNRTRAIPENYLPGSDSKTPKAQSQQRNVFFIFLEEDDNAAESS
jgi:hypothetical protein